jgi:peptidoglycan biosynthesis protein MviN/MurJ (putative lipid II flippase)
MSGQFVIGNLGMVMTSMFYAVGDTKSPTIVGIYAYTFGIFFKISLFYWMGNLGLALGVSIYFLISLILMQNKIAEKKYV